MLPGGRICAYIPQLKNMRKMYIYLSCARVTSLISKVSFFHLSYQIYCVCSLYLRTYLFWKIKSNLTEWRKSKLCILVVYKKGIQLCVKIVLSFWDSVLNSNILFTPALKSIHVLIHQLTVRKNLLDLWK